VRVLAGVSAVFVALCLASVSRLGGASQAADGDPVRVEAELAADPNAVQARGSAIAWHPSRAIGEPNGGRLENGVQLPAAGADYVTWDPVRKRRPNRGWRRWGTDKLIRVFLRVARQYRAAHRAAPQLVVGDLSRRHGGDFGPRFGGPGHASHQNGLDIDVYYPRRDHRLREPAKVSQIDNRLGQDLVDRFLAAGAQYIFVGPHTPFTGPQSVVQPLRLHDDHMHVRLYNPLPKTR
jgi:murein endopeptidase